MSNYYQYIFLRKFLWIFCIVFAGSIPHVHGQNLNDEYKLKLKKSLKVPDIKIHGTPKYSLLEIQQNNSEKIEVSPTTELPTPYKHFKGKYTDMIEDFKPDFSVTNVDKKSMLARSKIDYSDGKLHLIPDSRSIYQSAQYTRNDYGVGIYADEDSPEWLIKLRNKVTPQYKNIELDPVRYFEGIKARKRKEQIDKILRAYNVYDEIRSEDK